MKKCIMLIVLVLAFQMSFSQTKSAKKDTASKVVPLPPAAPELKPGFIITLDQNQLNALMSYITQDIYNEKGRKEFWDAIAPFIQRTMIPVK